MKCEYCGSKDIKNKKVYRGVVSICEDCSLGFNNINTIFDYQNESDFIIENTMLLKWNTFAARDAELISKKIEEKNEPINILEIGSGFGLVSNHIEKKINVSNYYHMEMNKNLVSFMKKNNKTCIESYSEINPASIDYVVMNHVLEHIESSYSFLLNLLNIFPDAKFILLQTNHKGFIPKYLPYFWYGWQLEQHYYHFTPTVFRTLENKGFINVESLEFYKLDQSASFSIKGMVKLMLKIINLFVSGKNADAFLVSFSRNNT